MRRITISIIHLILTFVLLVSPVFAQKKGAKSPPPPPKQEKQEEVKEIPPLVPLSPQQPVKGNKAEEKKEDAKGYKVIDAVKVEPKSVITQQTQAVEKSKVSERGLSISSMLSLYYDNNVLLFSTQEMVNFSHPEWNPNLVIGGTSAYRIKGYVDFATSPSIMISFFGAGDVEISLYAEGSFYFQNQILNRGTLGLGVHYPLSPKLTLKLSGFYQPERYYRELLYPEPYLNPYSTYSYATARYQTFFVPLIMGYDISKRVRLYFGYDLLGKKYNKLFNNNNLFYHGLETGGEFIPIQGMSLGISVGGGYAAANGDDPSTMYVESDPSHVRISPEFYVAYNGLNKQSFGISSHATISFYKTGIESDLQYYNRKDYLTGTYVWYGYEILKDMYLIASYNFAYNDTNFYRDGISANGVSDFEHQLIMLSLYYGSKLNIFDFSRVRMLSAGF